MQIHCKSILIAFLFSFYSLISFSQSQECGTQDPTEAEMQALPWYGNNAWLDQYVDSLSQTFSNCSNCRVEGSEEVWYRVPVKFYVWSWQGQDVFQRRDLNTNKVLKAMMFRLNDAMKRNNVPIRFYMLCPSFPENQQAATGIMNTTDACNFRSNNYTLGALNCHIFNDLDVNGAYCGRSDNNIIIQVAAITDRIAEYGEPMPNVNNSTFVHEVGHWLGLNHTHRDRQNRCDELVTRDWIWSICINSLAYTRQCALRADALCDTEASPNLDNVSGFINSDCEWTGNLTDTRGDLFRPDPKNYMAYGARICRSVFTWQQRAVMLRGINRQTGFFHVNASNDFDIYEPDNVPQAASQIRLNETQIHSFSTVGSCSDDSDWLKFNYPANGTASAPCDLLLEVEAIDGYNFPVSEVEFWDGGASGNFIAPNNEVRLNYSNTSITSSKITYRIPHNLPRGRTYLFRVVRNGSQTGRYKVTLKGLPADAQTIDNIYLVSPQLVCSGGSSFSLQNVPNGVNVTWEVISGANIVFPSSGNGSVANIAALPNASGSFQIRFQVNFCEDFSRTYTSDFAWAGLPTAPNTLLWYELGGSQSGVSRGESQPSLVYTRPWGFTYIDVLAGMPPTPSFAFSGYEWDGTAISSLSNGANNVLELSGTFTDFVRVRTFNACGESVWFTWNYRTEPCYEPFGNCSGGGGSPDPTIGFRYYPNPVKDILWVENKNKEIVSLALYTKYNQKVVEIDMTNLEEHKIDVKHLPNDVYFLHLIDRGGARVQRQVVLQK